MESSPGAAHALVLHSRKTSRSQAYEQAAAASDDNTSATHKYKRAGGRGLPPTAPTMSQHHASTAPNASSIGVRVSAKQDVSGDEAKREAGTQRSSRHRGRSSSHRDETARANRAAASSLAKPANVFFAAHGVQSHMKKAVALLLTNRPTDPVAFLAEYFRGAAQPPPPIVQSYRLIKLSSHSCSAFTDNLYAAYQAAGGPAQGCTAEEYNALIKALCVDMPDHIVPYVFRSLKHNANEVLDFADFAHGIHACVLYAEFFAAVATLFVQLNAAALPERDRDADRPDGAMHMCVPVRVLLPKLQALADDATIRTPMFETLRRELISAGGRPSGDGEVSFREFLSAVYRLTTVPSSIPSTDDELWPPLVDDRHGATTSSARFGEWE